VKLTEGTLRSTAWLIAILGLVIFVGTSALGFAAPIWVAGWVVFMVGLGILIVTFWRGRRGPGR